MCHISKQYQKYKNFRLFYYYVYIKFKHKSLIVVKVDCLFAFVTGLYTCLSTCKFDEEVISRIINQMFYIYYNIRYTLINIRTEVHLDSLTRLKVIYLKLQQNMLFAE